MFPIGPLAVPLIMAGVQTATGAIQRGLAVGRRRRALRDLNYEIPSATREIVQNARERASQTGLPGEDVYRSQQQSEIARTVAKGERVSDSISDVLGLYSKLYQTQTDTNRGLLVQGAQQKDIRERELNQSLGLLAQAQGEQFYYNRMLPVMNELGYATEQAQGGAANIAGGLQTAYSAYLNKFMMDEYSKIYGDQQNQNMAYDMQDVNNARLRTFGNMWQKQIPTQGIDVDRLRTPLLPIE